MEYKINDVRALNLNKKGSSRELRTLYNRKKKLNINKYDPEKGINKRKYGNGGWCLTNCIVNKLPENHLN